MPFVTSIEPQKKKKGRFNIFIDGKFAFGLDEYLLAKFHLKVNQSISEDLTARITKETDLSKLFDKSLKFLSFRPRSEKEIRDYLTAKIAKAENIEPKFAKESSQIEKIIEKLKRYKYLNDLEFAKWWFASRSKSHPKGLRLIALELKRKGIDRELIQRTLKRSSESDLAKAALAKKMAKWSKLPKIDLKMKVYRYLLSRGFDYETAKETFAFFAKTG